MKPVKLGRSLRFLQGRDFPGKLGICERVFARTLAAHGIQWVNTAADIPWKLDLRNATHRWIVYGKYEGAPFLDWAKGYLPPEGFVVDSGANIGQMLLYLAQWVPQGRVLAFEPGRHQAEWLRECLALNSQLPVELVRCGLGAESAELYLEETGGADRHGSWNQVSDSKGEPITIRRLDDLLAERSIEKIDLWKLDVEGYEIPALEGARRLLADRQVGALYVELAGDNGRAIRSFLEPLGYRCHLFSSSGRLDVPEQLPDHGNGLFLPAR